MPSSDKEGEPFKLTNPTENDLIPPKKYRGYPAIPGTGPEDETCGTCSHRFKIQLSKNYYKCGLMRHIWTGGYGTDIKLKSPACKSWKEDVDNDV